MISTRPLDLSDKGLERAADMIRASMPRGGHLTKEVLRWQYVENPSGVAVGLEAFDGDRLVSHCAVQPLVAKLHGEELHGVMSLNASTLPDYTGKGIYFALARQVYDSLRGSEYSFGIAVTNHQSTPGFIRHCGFRKLASLEARVGAGPVPVSRSMPEPEFEKVWDERTLAWRLAPPHRRYRCSVSKGTTRIFAPSGYPTLTVELAQLRDCAKLALPPIQLLRRFNLWVGLDPGLDWRRSMFWNIPHSLRPSPLNLIFSDLRGDLPALAAESVRWLALDFDDF